MYLDIEKMKREITMGDILNCYGIKLIQTSQNRLAGSCPIHHGDNQNAFHVDLEKNLFHCFTHCGGGSIFDFVMKKENLTFYKSALKIWNTFYFKHQQQHQNQYQYNTHDPQNQNLKLQYNHPYLFQRGIDENIARYFQIGYCQTGIMKNRIAIPIIDTDKKRIAYCGRAIDKDTSPKYLFPRHFNKSKYLFNIQNIIPSSPKPLFIVEGFFDCIHIVKHGFDAVALMGTSISQFQLELLIQINRGYILMLDGDEAGQKAMIKAKHQMKQANLEFKPVCLVDRIEPESLEYDSLRLLGDENIRL